MYRAYILPLLVIATASIVESNRAQLFTDHGFQGNAFEPQADPDVCFNLPGEFNDRISSIRAIDCVTLWQDINCNGAAVTFRRGASIPAFVDFNDAFSSGKFCRSND